METFVQVAKDGKIQSPDTLKIHIGNQILNFDNKIVREMKPDIKADNNLSALTELQKDFEGLAGELGIEDEEDVMALIREIRYGAVSAD